MIVQAYLDHQYKPCPSWQNLFLVSPSVRLPRWGSLILVDQKPFLSDKFDVNSYANAVLSGKIYDPESPSFAEGSGSNTANSKSRDTEKGDVGVELARLNYGIVCHSHSRSDRLVDEVGRRNEAASFGNHLFIPPSLGSPYHITRSVVTSCSNTFLARLTIYFARSIADEDSRPACSTIYSRHSSKPPCSSIRPVPSGRKVHLGS